MKKKLPAWVGSLVVSLLACNSSLAATAGSDTSAAEAAVRQAHRVPKKELLAGLIALAEADSQLKSSNPNPRALMEFLIARLTMPSAA